MFGPMKRKWEIQTNILLILSANSPLVGLENAKQYIFFFLTKQNNKLFFFKKRKDAQLFIVVDFRRLAFLLYTSYGTCNSNSWSSSSIPIAALRETYSGVLNGTRVPWTRVPCNFFIFIFIFLKFDRLKLIVAFRECYNGVLNET